MANKHICKYCGGSGKVKCPRCDGYGVMNDNQKSTCYYCQGRKQIVCTACDGKGIIED